MKKQNVVVSIALATVLLAVPVLGGCSSESYSEVKFPAQDTSYAVTSQGGSAVSYGNYIYYINGTRGYDDADGKGNVWNEVVKGGLYRAELNGKKVSGDGGAKFESVFDAKGLEFKYTESEDYYGNPVNVVNTVKIAPKTVGVKNYAGGGIFIYDNYAYFASPNNQRNAAGNVQTTRTDFFMMPLNGGSPTRVYTSSEGVDTSGSAYAFYKFDGKVYLVVNENTDIVSVEIDTAKQKAADPVKYEANATSVYFPVRETYYNGISTDTPEDFIYFVRNVDDDDKQRAGTVIQAMRPDGSEKFIVSENGNTETIEAVRDGVLFYRTTDVLGNTVLAYDNLHEALMYHSKTYAAAQNGKSAEDKNVQIDGRFATNMSSVTTAYAFRPDLKSNVVYFVGGNSSNFWLYDINGPVQMLYAGSGTVQFVKNNFVYVSGSSSDYYRFPLYTNMDDFGQSQDLASGTTSAGISCDYVNGYFTYFGKVDQWADGYTYFSKVDGVQGLEPQFIGELASSDKPSEKELEEIKNGTADND